MQLFMRRVTVKYDIWEGWLNLILIQKRFSSLNLSHIDTSSLLIHELLTVVVPPSRF